MSKIIIVWMVLLSSSLSLAETTNKPVEAGTKTWDQPSNGEVSNLRPGVDIPANPGPMEPADPNRITPPTKGVIHVSRDADREHPIDALYGAKGTVLKIDPENERPLDSLYGNKTDHVTAITVWGVGPGKVPGVDFPDPRNPRIVTDPYVPPWEDNMPKYEIVKEMARSLDGIKIDDRLSFAVIASAGLLAATYLIASRTGATAAVGVMPTDIIQTAMGDIIKVPKNNVYTTLDILDFRDQVLNSESNEDVQDLMDSADDEFVKYWNSVYFKVKQERSRAYQKTCPNPEICS